MCRCQIIMRFFRILTLVLIPGCFVLSFVPTIRIMPLGDSLTSGEKSRNTGGYRQYLLKKLESNGYNVDFIGTVKDSNSTLSDSDHEGHEWTIKKMFDSIQDIFDDIKADPDIILLLLGGNEIRTQSTEIEEMIQQWDDLILRISSVHPYAHILASNLTPQQSRNVTLFNEFAEAIVDKHIKAGRRVTFVDMHSAFGPQELVDRMHPNSHGYSLMANVWMQKISQVMRPIGDNLPVEVIRVEGSLDRFAVTITFNKPLNDSSRFIENFFFEPDLKILNTTLDNERRKIIIDTSEQLVSRVYNISFPLPSNIIDLAGNSMRPNSNSISFTVGWRFIVMADWHNAEKYIWDNPYTVKEKQNDIKVFSFLRQNYGGDLIIVPGDTNSGTWHKYVFRKRLGEKLGSDVTSPVAAIDLGGYFCYNGMASTLRAGGYSKILIAIGDHEAGDNPWPSGSVKSKMLSSFRKSIFDNFNTNYNGDYRFQQSIGNVPSRPLHTEYEWTSNAYIHKNILFVTVDVLYQKSFDVDLGRKGTVEGRVTGKHLDWLEQVLEAGQNHPEVDHIFVQGHFPVIHPVRRSKSSGQMMVDNERSEFWQVLKKHNVDIYFCGEVHLNTVSKDDNSNLIQVASRGNQFTNFLTVDVSKDTIYITLNNEIGTKPIMYNYEYEQNGRLIVRKNEFETKINSFGELKLLDRKRPLVHFDFERVTSLKNRPIVGLGYITSKETPTTNQVVVDNVPCLHSLPNIGEFGQNYDAQVAHISLVQGKYGLGGNFTSESRVAIYGMGPHSEGEPVSYALWFKTVSNETQILISYKGWWESTHNYVATLRLQSGIPEFVVSSSQKITSSNLEHLNTGVWVHIAVSVPFKDCKLSEVEMFINGEIVETLVAGNDENIYFPNGGLLALGGFGHSNIREKDFDDDNNFDEDDNFYEKESTNNFFTQENYSDGNRFNGVMDDVYIFSRSLSRTEIWHLMEQTTISPTISASPTKMNSIEPSYIISTTPSENPSVLYTPSPSEIIPSEPSLIKSSAPSQNPSTFKPSSVPSATPSIASSIRPSSNNSDMIPSVFPMDNSTNSREPSHIFSDFPSENRPPSVPSSLPDTETVISSAPCVPHCQYITTTPLFVLIFLFM